MSPQLKKILIDQVYWPSIKRLRKFLKSRDDIKISFNNSEMIKVKLFDLNETLSKILDIDWIQIINNELFEESKLTENDEILIEGGIEMFKSLANNLMITEGKTIADKFVITFIYDHRFQIILRFYNNQVKTVRGLKHGQQKWHTRIRRNSFEKKMQPVLLVMYEQYRPIWDRTLGDFDRDLSDERSNITGNAKKLIQEVVDEFKKRFLMETSLKLPIEISAKILFKLKTLKIFFGLPKSIFSVASLEEFYKNLNLNGDENFMKSHWEIRKFNRKLTE
ncbi:hypothetical protein PVAND_014876 [Polypedilum vanderplanki]|uniref:Uncharacterized protein n=1 Tax=Polypedilum vanderplanki TaxID=319348 RepID=A0A9J6BAM6_POLVA|nr:hypothetical protein PVAND_014876 [Polypedilum vanderplanki]